MIGRQFTWANNLPEPTYEKLDHVLMDMDWELKFPMVSVRALERIVEFSDHASILLSTGLPKTPSNCRYKFELGWLNWEGFQTMVKRIWERTVVGLSSIQRWSNKMRVVRKSFCTWLGKTHN
jgi:hypothetical protein